MENKIYINHRGTIFNPEPIEEIQWSTRLYGAGELKFKVLKDNVMDFKEGDQVTFYRNNIPIFKGYVFAKERHKNSPITVLCYDQLRYFKNKDTYTYSNITASGLLKMIASDYNLTTGDMANTAYVLPLRIEDNSTLFDIMYNALESTEKYNRQKYVLYDDFGAIVLKNSLYMGSSFLADSSDIIEYKYTSSIDSNVYNSVKLKYEKTTKYTHISNVYTAKDTEKIKEWGLLQLYEHIGENIDGNAYANMLLNKYKTKSRTLKICTFGDISMRAGTIINVNLDIGDFVLNNRFTVRECEHTYKDNEEYMWLTVDGGVLNE